MPSRRQSLAALALALLSTIATTCYLYAGRSAPSLLDAIAALQAANRMPSRAEAFGQLHLVPTKSSRVTQPYGRYVHSDLSSGLAGLEGATIELTADTTALSPPALTVFIEQPACAAAKELLLALGDYKVNPPPSSHVSMLAGGRHAFQGPLGTDSFWYLYFTTTDGCPTFMHLSLTNKNANKP